MSMSIICIYIRMTKTHYLLFAYNFIYYLLCNF